MSSVEKGLALPLANARFMIPTKAVCQPQTEYSVISFLGLLMTKMVQRTLIE